MKYLIFVLAFASAVVPDSRAATLGELVGKYSFRYAEDDPEIPTPLKAYQIRLDLEVKADGSTELTHTYDQRSFRCRGHLDLVSLAKFYREVVNVMDCDANRQFGMVIHLADESYRDEGFRATVYTTMWGSHQMDVRREK